MAVRPSAPSADSESAGCAEGADSKDTSTRPRTPPAARPAPAACAAASAAPVWWPRVTTLPTGLPTLRPPRATLPVAAVVSESEAMAPLSSGSVCTTDDSMAASFAPRRMRKKPPSPQAVPQLFWHAQYGMPAGTREEAGWGAGGGGGDERGRRQCGRRHAPAWPARRCSPFSSP